MWLSIRVDRFWNRCAWLLLLLLVGIWFRWLLIMRVLFRVLLRFGLGLVRVVRVRFRRLNDE